jgi:hypothetical protein
MKNRPNNLKLKDKLRVYLDPLRRSKKEYNKRNAKRVCNSISVMV